jgi:hypothetical protein
MERSKRLEEEKERLLRGKKEDAERRQYLEYNLALGRMHAQQKKD